MTSQRKRSGTIGTGVLSSGHDAGSKKRVSAIRSRRKLLHEAKTPGQLCCDHEPVGATEYGNIRGQSLPSNHAREEFWQYKVE